MKNKLGILNAILIGIAVSLFPVFFQEARAAIHASLLISLVLTGIQLKNKENIKFENKALITALFIYSISLLIGYFTHPSDTVLHRLEISIYVLLYALFIPIHIKLFNIKHYAFALVASALITFIYLVIYYDFNQLKRLSLATNAINIYATIAASMAALCIHYAIKLEKLNKVALIISSLIFILSLTLTQTRGAWLALIVFLILSSLLDKKLRKTIIVIFVLLAAALPFNDTAKKRISSIKHGMNAYFVHNKPTSIGQRFDMWSNTITAIKEKPITGYGDSSLEKRYKTLSSKDIKPLRQHPHAHNEFLEAWSSFGVFHFLATIILFLGLLFPNFRINKNNIPLVTVFLITGMSETLLNNAYSIQFLIIFSLLNIHINGKKECI